MGVRYLIILFFLCCTVCNYSQETSFERGKIIDSLIVANTQETFALYLPKSYDANTPSSIVLIFDPSGIGRLGVSVFIPAAETYNHILVCSNNTKNGVPYETNFEITNRLTEFVFNTFNINNEQMYTAGFSGGSRLASAIAALTGKIQGVVACGAGLSVNQNFTPKESMFSFVGLVGDEDMNYFEMLNSKNWLSKYNIDNELFINGDNHRWPPKDQILRAFGWLEMQAYKRKLKPVNIEVIHSLYENQSKIAKGLIDNNMLRALDEYESLQRNFSSYYDLDSINQRIEQIKSSSLYKTQMQKRRDIAQQEDDLFNTFSKVYKAEVKAAKSDDNFNWWKTTIKQLDDDIQVTKDNMLLKMYKRVRYSVFAGVIESSNAYRRASAHQHMVYCDKLLTIFNPDQWYWYFRLAQSYALLNDEAAVIRNLKKAIKHGYTRTDTLSTVAEFKPLLESKRFKNFLQKNAN